MSVAIEFRGVTKAYGAQRVVDGVSLEVAAGELFFLLGPSGCGKTTLLRCLAGFLAPDAGRVLLGGRDVTDLPPEARGTAMVFQSYALWPHLTVRENVAFGLEIRGAGRDEIRRRTDEALARVRLADRAAHRPGQLSGGQQQRVALARALVVRPQCLLLDEPLSNLDAKLRLEMRAEIRRLCKQAGLTALYVTHDQKEALSIADRVAILDRGAIQQCGPPRDVYLRPRSRFVAGFIGETNLLEGRVVAATDGALRIETAAGMVLSRVPPPGGATPGAAVALSVRPEAIRLGGPPPADAANVFRGEVHDTLYLGEMAQHQVGLAGGRVQLKVFDLNPEIFARDDEVREAAVWFSPDDAVVLDA